LGALFFSLPLLGHEERPNYHNVNAPNEELFLLHHGFVLFMNSSFRQLHCHGDPSVGCGTFLFLSVLYPSAINLFPIQYTHRTIIIIIIIIIRPIRVV